MSHYYLKEVEMSRIHPEKLIALRTQANLTAESLAENAKVGRATITRIENGKTASSNRATVARIAEALRCSPEVLATPPEPESKSSFPGERYPIAQEMSAEAHNALVLTARRYGETTETILELAPLLFDLFARQSLKARKEHLATLRGYRSSVAAMEAEFSHLSGRLFCDWQAEEIDYAEEKALEKNDLRGEALVHDTGIEDYFFPKEYDEESDNPFVVHLRNRFGQLDDDKEVPAIEAWPKWRSPVYQTCKIEALAIAGGEEDLADAVIRGVVRIASIPKHLRGSDATDERKVWMRAQISKHTAQLAEFFGDMRLETDIGGEQS
jgi:transcriptional regulator with XRE-family HTH domain